MIEAKIIADSISDSGKRITTLQLVYPRFIHSEFMTHRVFSRNASSSRAIPVKKMIEMIRANPAMPIHWGSNIAGMQAKEELSENKKAAAKELWHNAANEAANIAEKMMKLGLHKQVSNRILEPFQHIHVLVTATEWDNWDELRIHEDAQPEIHELALCIREARVASTPRVLAIGEWHLPYVTEEERDNPFYKIEANRNMLKKISAARCCRVSYLKHDGEKPNKDDDLALFQRLAGSVPKHYSPLEHQATPDTKNENGNWNNPNLHGNLNGWIQFRRIDQFGMGI